MAVTTIRSRQKRVLLYEGVSLDSGISRRRDIAFAKCEIVALGHFVGILGASGSEIRHLLISLFLVGGTLIGSALTRLAFHRSRERADHAEREKHSKRSDWRAARRAFK